MGRRRRRRRPRVRALLLREGHRRRAGMVALQLLGVLAGREPRRQHAAVRRAAGDEPRPPFALPAVRGGRRAVGSVYSAQALRGEPTNMWWWDSLEVSRARSVRALAGLLLLLLLLLGSISFRTRVNGLEVGGGGGGVYRARDPIVNFLISPDSRCKKFSGPRRGGGGGGGSNRQVPPTH